jgi:serine/threonine-protein kinase
MKKNVIIQYCGPALLIVLIVAGTCLLAVAQFASKEQEIISIEDGVEKLKSTISEVRDEGARELVAAGRESVPYLITIIKDERTNYQSRASACKVLGGLKTREAVMALIDALQDRSFAVRNTAMQMLIDIDDNRIGREAARLLRDNREYVRVNAIFLIDERRDTAAVSAVREALRRDTSYSVRATAARALGRMKDRDALYLLIEKATDDESLFVREEAVTALRELGDKKAIPALIKVLREEFPSIRKKALYGLEDITEKHFGDDADAWEGWYEEQR